MIIGAFLFYMVLFLFVFSSPEKFKQKDRRFSRLFVIPALVALLLTFLTVIKVFFIYKIFILIFAGFTSLLAYWQWGNKIKHWFKD